MSTHKITFKNQEVEFLTKPLTPKELKKLSDENLMVTGVVPVKLSKIINSDQDEFLDYLGERLAGSCLLMDIQYEAVGAEGNTVYLEVTGEVSSILDFEGDDENE